MELIKGWQISLHQLIMSLLFSNDKALQNVNTFLLLTNKFPPLITIVKSKTRSMNVLLSTSHTCLTIDFPLTIYSDCSKCRQMIPFDSHHLAYFSLSYKCKIIISVTQKFASFTFLVPLCDF